MNDLPIARIRQAVHPTPEQTALLDDLNAASAKANGVITASCSSEHPLIPVDRLEAAKKRISAMIDAVQIVRTPLEKFYDSLSDEQRQLFDKVGSSEGNAPVSGTDPQKLCGDKNGATDVPVQRIEQVVQPNAQQQEAFDALKAAAAKAADQLQASCPTATPLTPVARTRSGFGATYGHRCGDGHRSPGARELLRLVERRAEGEVQHHGTTAKSFHGARADHRSLATRRDPCAGTAESNSRADDQLAL